MRVLHVFRAPVGGLFRHVCDLVAAQTAAGIDVGIVCDTLTGGDYSNKLIEGLEAKCKLGIHRMPMPRMPALVDLANTRRVTELALQSKANILHGHGSKGGLHARLAGHKSGIASLYTPHGGVLNYEWSSLTGPLFLGTEKYLVSKGSGFAFVCDYERETFDRKIGIGGKPYVVVHNGLWSSEFKRIEPGADASDFLFAGEMRFNKGVDLLLHALANLNRERKATLTLAGDGPQFAEYKALASSLGLDGVVRFIGRVPIAKAFSLGRIFILPSRFESFPYVVMEAIASGLPLRATAVGGIPEVVPPEMLIAAVDSPAITNSLREVLSNEQMAGQAAMALSRQVQLTTTVEIMSEKITGLYARLTA